MLDRSGGVPSLRQRLGQFATLQQRFEESPAGRKAISALAAIILIIGIAWNLPDSPIKRALLPVIQPIAAATYLNQGWGLFAPDVPKRTETMEVQVTMDDGSLRVWAFRSRNPLGEAFTWVRWKRLVTFAINKADLRPGISRWAARQVTGPADHPVHLAMVLRVQNLSPPTENTTGATATKVLYEEQLPGRL